MKKLKKKDKFHWQTSEGDILTPDEMKTSHIFFCVRMIYNHTVPPEFQTSPHKRWIMPPHFNLTERCRAIQVFLEQLALPHRRSELSPWMIKELWKMYEGSCRSLNLTFPQLQICNKQP